MTSELTLFADYHQIHLFDEGSTTDLGTAWAGSAVEDQLAAAEDAMAIGTVADVDVAVEVQILDEPPEVALPEFDHVVEHSLRVSSGRVVVMGCTDFEPEAARFEIKPGWVRIRVAKSNMTAAYAAGIDSDESPATTEKLKVLMWPAPATASVVLKRWSPPSS